MSALSRPLHELDCPTRMFLASLCLSDADLEELGFLPMARTRSVSPSTAARTALHRVCREDARVGRAVTDLLDLRHAETVLHVRSVDARVLESAARHLATEAEGERLCAWVWSLLTDPRDAVFRLGRRLMAECYVRGLQHLGATRSPDLPVRVADEDRIR